MKINNMLRENKKRAQCPREPFRDAITLRNYIEQFPERQNALIGNIFVLACLAT